MSAEAERPGLIGLDAIRVPKKSVAEVLSGIRMPCDLAPLMGVTLGEGVGSDPGTDLSIDPSHLAFTTEGHPPAEVGTQLGDELERIGCDLHPVDDATLRVDRGGDSVEVRIHPDGPSVMAGNERRFPTAAHGSVVVEFTVR